MMPPRQMLSMLRAIRLLTALFLFASFAMVGGAQTATADAHSGMADCPHAAGTMPGHGAPPAPMGKALPLPLCCYGLSSIAASEIPLRLPLRLAATLPRPGSERLPAGDPPGPELPPPRS